MPKDFEGKRFEKYPVTPQAPHDEIVEFNSALREVAAAEFGRPDRGTTTVTHINEMRGFFDISQLAPEDEDTEHDIEFSSDKWLELVRGYLANGGQLFLRGQTYLPADLDEVDIRSQYSADIIAPNEIVFLDIAWDSLLEAIRERRFVIDPNPYAELFALTTDERTVIGELLFSDEPTPQGFARAEDEL